MAAFLHRLTEKHEVSNAEFLVDGSGYLTALFRHELNGHLNYREWNHMEKWFQTVSMRIDRFHTFWRGSQSSARRWLLQFRYYYNRDRPNQALDNRTPVDEVRNQTVPKSKLSKILNILFTDHTRVHTNWNSCMFIYRIFNKSFQGSFPRWIWITTDSLCE